MPAPRKAAAAAKAAKPQANAVGVDLKAYLEGSDESKLFAATVTSRGNLKLTLDDQGEKPVGAMFKKTLDKGVKSGEIKINGSWISFPKGYRESDGIIWPKQEFDPKNI